MEAEIRSFRAFLRSLIETEQQQRNFSTVEMLAFMQRSPALPPFYQVPAQQAANKLLIDSDDTAFSAALAEAIKAEYGAWIREHYRQV